MFMCVRIWREGEQSKVMERIKNELKVKRLIEET